MNTIVETLQAGLPVLIVQFAISLALLAFGVALYVMITPFREARLIAEGNVAAGIVLMGAILGLAIPLAATLGTSHVTLDILLWGCVALVLQIVVVVLVTLFVRGMRQMIEAGNVAAACVLAGCQIGVGLLNAGAMAG